MECMCFMMQCAKKPLLWQNYWQNIESTSKYPSCVIKCWLLYEKWETLTGSCYRMFILAILNRGAVLFLYWLMTRSFEWHNVSLVFLPEVCETKFKLYLIRFKVFSHCTGQAPCCLFYWSYLNFKYFQTKRLW